MKTARKYASFLALLALAILPLPACSAAPQDNPSSSHVLTGLDILAGQGFLPLAGKRVGLVTNHTGVDRTGKPGYRLLAENPNVELVAVFTPEHGLKGTIEGDYEADKPPQGIPRIYSLYGENRKPRLEWLQGIDILLFDIQDIGSRFYTYITTMALCMQASATAGVEFCVLDRPNPVGGLAVEGPVLEDSLCGDFIAYYPIPVRHGMTVGELARLFNTEFAIGVRLNVIQMNRWRRGMYYDQTDLAWIDPSPNMRSLQAAILYPGLGISEATNLSVGRGTDIPFEIYGAPYVDGAKLAAELDSAGLDGVTFKDTTFTPVSHVFPNETCGGVRAEVTDRDMFNSVRAGLHLLSALERLYPDTFQLTRIDRWIGLRSVKQEIEHGVPVEEIEAGWKSELEEFKQTRKKYLLYTE
jgi:uncharacterized protein YbbC (DUF1343 family)